MAFKEWLSEISLRGTLALALGVKGTSISTLRPGSMAAVPESPISAVSGETSSTSGLTESS